MLDRQEAKIKAYTKFIMKNDSYTRSWLVFTAKWNIYLLAIHPGVMHSLARVDTQTFPSSFRSVMTAFFPLKLWWHKENWYKFGASFSSTTDYKSIAESVVGILIWSRLRGDHTVLSNNLGALGTISTNHLWVLHLALQNHKIEVE